MDADDSLLNQAFDYDAGENIAVTDVISFMQEIRAAPTERISELCNYFDDTDTMPFTSFIKLIQEFVEKKRNSFSEESSDDQDHSEFHNTNSNLEGCGGDISTVSAFEPDVGELLLKNKNLSRSNSNLKSETSELRKQIDTYEEECEAQRRKIAELDKDLRQCQESKPNVQLLLKEKDDLQNRVFKQQEENSTLVLREKNLKEESEDYRTRLSCMQDRYDSISSAIDQLQRRNVDLEQENEAVKSACENLQVAIDNKDEVIAMKTRECTELTERVHEYESTIDDLQEEKEALSAQVREVQLEYSICQKAVNGSAPATPVRSSIQHELNQADDGIANENYQSPICGTNYIKGNKQQNSPLTDTLKKGLLASLVQSPSSPRERITLLKRSLSEVAIQTDSCDVVSSQTDQQISVETSTQTEIEEIHNQKDSLIIEEEDKIFDERSTEIEKSIKNYQDRIFMLEQCNDELKVVVEREKGKAQYLIAQVGANRAKLQTLQELLAKEQDKISELTDINVKLCSSKLDIWRESTEKVQNYDEMEKWSSSVTESRSLLIEALCLAEVKPVKWMETDQNLLHGRHASHYSTENCKQIVIACEANQSTINGRFTVLHICRNMIEDAIAQKVEMLLEMLREILYSDDFVTSSGLHDLRKLNATFSRTLRSIQSLGVKMEKVGFCIGARNEEKKMQPALKVLSNGLSDLKRKYEEANHKLQQLFKISLDCQCLCAIDMLSVLKDVEHSEEENSILCTEKVKLISELTGPFLKFQTEGLQKYFDEMDKSVATILGRLVPSKFWIMVLLFSLFGYLSFHWEDYHVPQAV